MRNPFKLELLPPDPIFGVEEAFRNDDRPGKISLVVGSYRNEEGKPWPLPSVMEAEKRVQGQSEEYLPIEGDPRFLEGVKKLLGRDLVVFQAIGGAGALTLGGELAKRGIEGATIHLPNPSWANHTPLFKRVGLKIETYPYPEFDQMVEMIEGLGEKDLVLLHLVCHNPTGIDPTDEEWKRLSQAFVKGGAIPFFDLAYLGFGLGIKEDLEPLKYFTAAGIPFLLAFSCSKSFGLYGERVGALCVSANSGKQEILSQGKQWIRSCYSNSPLFGASVVAKILSDKELQQAWEKDVQQMRHRLQVGRRLFLERIETHLPNVEKGRGMFSLLPLKLADIRQLREEFALYLPDSGRISFANITSKNVDFIVNILRPLLS